MSRQIYELTVLGMHPASLYPRRSQVAPIRQEELRAGRFGHDPHSQSNRLDARVQAEVHGPAAVIGTSGYGTCSSYTEDHERDLDSGTEGSPFRCCC